MDPGLNSEREADRGACWTRQECFVSRVTRRFPKIWSFPLVLQENGGEKHEAGVVSPAKTWIAEALAMLTSPFSRVEFAASCFPGSVSDPFDLVL